MINPRTHGVPRGVDLSAMKVESRPISRSLLIFQYEGKFGQFSARESRNSKALFAERRNVPSISSCYALRRKNGRECEWDAKKIRKESLSELGEDEDEKTFFSFLPPQPYLALTEDALFIKPKKLSFPLKRHKKARRAVHCAELVNVLGSRKSRLATSTLHVEDLVP